MKSFVMIDKEEYDSHAHVPKREYEETLKRASEKDTPAFERALFFYDALINNLKKRPSITEESLLSFLISRKAIFIKDCEARFGIEKKKP